MGEDDFDAEAFLGVKPENLEKADIFSGANATLMDKYIQVLSYEQTSKGQMQKGGPPGLPPPTGGFQHVARKQVQQMQSMEHGKLEKLMQSPMRKNS